MAAAESAADCDRGRAKRHGKSTLANRLFGRQVSITADLPGTTRDWVGEIADIDGLAALLVDTPGQRDAEDAIERAAIAASREQIEGSDLIIKVLDATARPGNAGGGSDVLIVINKIDQPSGWEFQSFSAMGDFSKDRARDGEPPPRDS